MKCPKCKGVMHDDYDRKRCLICGHSAWKGYTTRKPAAAERNITGRIAGHNKLKENS
jgi:rRNA maturation endonuclease Nob1